jgi:hypothetical protein
MAVHVRKRKPEIRPWPEPDAGLGEPAQDPAWVGGGVRCAESCGDGGSESVAEPRKRKPAGIACHGNVPPWQPACVTVGLASGMREFEHGWF